MYGEGITKVPKKHKKAIKDIGKMKEEEKFLSNKLQYEITDYTKRLLGFYDSNKVANVVKGVAVATPAPTMEAH